MAEMYVAHQPSSYKEAIQDDERDAWKVSMIEEMVALRDHKTWTMVYPQMVKQKLINFKCVLTRLQKSDTRSDLLRNGSNKEREYISTRGLRLY